MAQSPMSAVSMLCAALEHGDAADWPCDRNGSDRLEALLASRLIVELPLAKHLACPHCHEMAEVHCEDNGTVRLRCEDRTILNRNRLRRWRADSTKLADFLRANLRLNGAFEERIDGRLWLLGRMVGKGDGFPLWLLVGSDDAGVRLSSVQQLQQRSPAEQGVLISSSSSALSTVWPRGSEAVLLKDVLTFSKTGKASVAEAPIWNAAPRGKRGPGQRGALKKNDSAVVDVFWQRVADGTASRKSCSQEAREIMELESKLYGEDLARAPRYIASKIGKSYKRWKESDYTLTGP